MKSYSNRRVAGIPRIAYPLNFFDEVRAVNLERSIRLGPARVVFVRNVEGVPEESNVCCLQSLERLKG